MVSGPKPDEVDHHRELRTALIDALREALPEHRCPTSLQRDFGSGLASDSSAKDEWETSVGGEFTATSVDGSVTGRRGDLILVDDPVKGRAEANSDTVRETAWTWWVSDLRTRLKPGGAIALIMTRWHEDDLAGRILPADYDGQSGSIQARDGEIWRVISIRAEAEAGDPLKRQPGQFCGRSGSVRSP